MASCNVGIPSCSSPVPCTGSRIRALLVNTYFYIFNIMANLLYEGLFLAYAIAKFFKLRLRQTFDLMVTSCHYCNSSFHSFVLKNKTAVRNLFLTLRRRLNFGSAILFSLFQFGTVLKCLSDSAAYFIVSMGVRIKGDSFK